MDLCKKLWKEIRALERKLVTLEDRKLQAEAIIEKKMRMLLRELKKEEAKK